MNKLITLGANDEYIQQSKAYGKKDALLSLILYISLMLMYWIMGNLFVSQRLALSETYIFCATGILALACMGLVVLFCFLQKQKLSTIGFSKSKSIKSLIMGFALSTIVIIVNITAIVSGSTPKTNITLIIIKVIYFLIFIALMEEVVFRGYIGARLFGYFNNKLLAITVVGIMFSLMHIPFQMAVVQMSLQEYISAQWGNLIFTFLFHLVFQWLYAKYNSIIAPTILHFVWDFVGWFVG